MGAFITTTTGASLGDNNLCYVEVPEGETAARWIEIAASGSVIRGYGTRDRFDLAGPNTVEISAAAFERAWTGTDSPPNELGQRWVWVMDIIFGGLLVFGLQGFAQQFSLLSLLSSAQLLSVLLAAVGVTAFFVYDVTVHHVLTSATRAPFQKSWPSALRFSLDVAMAFTLALILLPGLEYAPWTATFRILVAATAWHVGAVLWHWLARTEYPEERGAWGWHIAGIGAYWIGLVVTTEISGYRSESLFASFNRPVCLDVLAILLLMFAIARTWTLLELSKRQGRNSDVENPIIAKVLKSRRVGARVAR